MTLSTGAKVGIGIGITVGIIAAGLLIWFVIWPAIANAIGTGKEMSYNGGGSGNTGYIRKWIDDHTLDDCGKSPNMCEQNEEGLCPLSTGFAQLLTQDGLYILSYDDNGKIFLSPSQSPKGGNIWYLCFYNENYNGTLVAANQLCNSGKNLCNLFWECDSTQGVKPCSQLTNYKGGKFPPGKVQLDSACKSTGDGSCSLTATECRNPGRKSDVTMPCLAETKKNGPYPVEQSVFINPDDTISTLPSASISHTKQNMCDDPKYVKYCMANTYYIGLTYPEYDITTTLVNKLGVRFNIVDCDATQVNGIWTCTPK